jgi:uncharacterized protein YecT (DUF1311 family)
MIRTLCIAAFLLTATPAFLAAQDDEEFCPKGRTQLDMNNCAAAELAHADRALNETYQAVLRLLDPERVELLREAQRAWIRWRDAECEFEASEFAGGSMEPMIQALCLAHVTKERTKALAPLVTDRGGGG